jgi:asparagine synthetase B (glutamine-hydrolysing)
MHLGHAARVEVQPAHAITLVSAVAAMLEEPIADPASVTQYAVCAVASLHGRTAFAGHGASALPATATAHALWDSRQRRQLYTRTFTEDIRGTQLAGGPSSTVTPFRSDYRDDEPGDTSAYVRTRTAWSRIPDSTLPLAQRAALATGLELRFPFASRSILELTARLNTESGRLADGFPSLLHRLVQRRVPSTLMPDARLSIVPDWLRGILAALVPSVLLAHRFDARGIVSRVALQSLWNEHCRGREDHSLRLWALLVLELWLRQSVDSEASAEPEPMSLLRVA